MPQQLAHGTQIHTVRYQSTGERVPMAMPDVVLHLGTLYGIVEPSTRPLRSVLKVTVVCLKFSGSFLRSKTSVRRSLYSVDAAPLFPCSRRTLPLASA